MRLRRSGCTCQLRHQRHDAAQLNDLLLVGDVAVEGGERRGDGLLHLGATLLEQLYQRRHTTRIHDRLLVLLLAAAERLQGSRRGSLRFGARRGISQELDEWDDAARLGQHGAMLAVHLSGEAEDCHSRAFPGHGVAAGHELDLLGDDVGETTCTA